MLVLALARDSEPKSWSTLETFGAALLRNPAFPDWVKLPMMQRCLDMAGHDLAHALVSASAKQEQLDEAHQLALVRVLSQLEKLPSFLTSCLAKHPSPILREWWASQAEV